MYRSNLIKWYLLHVKHVPGESISHIFVLILSDAGIHFHSSDINNMMISNYYNMEPRFITIRSRYYTYTITLLFAIWKETRYDKLINLLANGIIIITTKNGRKSFSSIDRRRCLSANKSATVNWVRCDNVQSSVAMDYFSSILIPQPPGDVSKGFVSINHERHT